MDLFTRIARPSLWLVSALILAAATPQTSPAQAGTLDPTFGDGGIVTTDFEWPRSHLDHALGAVIQQPDGNEALAQPCPDADYTMTTQQQLDAFPNTCTEISGGLLVSGPDVTDLQPLARLTLVGGSLSIEYNSSLTHLGGLEELTNVIGTVIISGNTLLDNLDGLRGLRAIGGSLSISSNKALANIDGLSGISSVDRSLRINGNAVLTDLIGLSNVTLIGGGVSIASNSALINVDGLAALRDVRGQIFWVYANRSLTNLDGLASLTTLEGDMWIANNFALTNLDGLSQLTSVGGSLLVAGNTSLADVNGLSALVTVGSLSIRANPILTNLDGLTALTTVGWDLEITSNTDLTNVDGLAAVRSVGNAIVVRGNPSLASCSCGLYGCMNGNAVPSVIMADNYVRGDCNNEGADLIAIACGSVATEDEVTDAPEQYTVHPVYANPVRTTTTISFDLPRMTEILLAVYDIRGRQVQVLATGTRPAGTHEVVFDAKATASGLYFVRLRAGEYGVTKRMVVVR